MTPDQRRELQELADAAVEGRLTPEQIRRLEALVLADGAARRFYVEYLHQHASLHWSAADPATLRGSPATLPLRRPKQARRLRVVALIAAAAALLFVVWLGLRPSAPASASGFAELASGKACKWDGGTLPTEVGARLSAGRLRLAEGLA